MMQAMRKAARPANRVGTALLVRMMSAIAVKAVAPVKAVKAVAADKNYDYLAWEIEHVIRVTSHENRVTSHENRVTSHENRVARHDERVEHVAGQHFAYQQLQSAMNYKCDYQATRGLAARQLVFETSHYRATICWTVETFGLNCAAIEWINVEPVQLEVSSAMPNMVAQQWIVWLVNQACKMLPGDYTVCLPMLKPDKLNLLGSLENAGMTHLASQETSKQTSIGMIGMIGMPALVAGRADKFVAESDKMLAKQWPASRSMVAHVCWTA